MVTLLWRGCQTEAREFSREVINVAYLYYIVFSTFATQYTGDGRVSSCQENRYATRTHFKLKLYCLIALKVLLTSLYVL